MVRSLWRVVLVFAAVGVVVAVGWHLYGGRWKRDYEQRVAALRAAGVPTRPEELATPPIPDEENGAKLLEQAHRILAARQKESTADALLMYDLDRTAGEEAALAAYLDSLAPYFEMLRRVPERPGWRLDLDWKAGYAMRIDLLSQLREVHQYAVERVQVDNKAEGRTERAAEAAALMLALGAKCRGPGLIGYLVAMSLSDVEEFLRIAMRRPGFDAATFRRIVDPPLARAIPERGLPREVFVQERTFLIGTVTDLVGGAPDRKGRKISFLQLPDLYREAAEALDATEKAIARCDSTPEEALVAAKELRPTFRAAEPVFGDIAGVYSRSFRTFADNVADRRLTRVAMALLEYRQREGRWPESLAALGEMPADPYSGGPFLYERTEGGCRVHAANDSTPDDVEEDRLGWTFRDDQLPAIAR